MNERHFMRKVDLTYIIVVLTLCGSVWAIIQKPVKWDQTAKEVEEMKPRLSSVETKATELDARNTAQMTMIIHELDGIHRELKGWKSQAAKIEVSEKG